MTTCIFYLGLEEKGTGFQKEIVTCYLQQAIAKWKHVFQDKPILMSELKRHIESKDDVSKNLSCKNRTRLLSKPDPMPSMYIKRFEFMV